MEGTLTSTGGDVELSPAGRTAVPSIATIADDPTVGNSVTIDALGLTVGPLEKITVLGNLTINVGTGTAVLGDINTGGSLNVTAGRTVFQLRPSGNILTSSDSLVSEGDSNPPGGTDVVVLGPNLTFNTPAITTTGTGTPVRFATTTGKGNVPGQQVLFYSTSFGAALKDAANTPLDLQARSFTVETIASSLPLRGPSVYGEARGYGPGETMDVGVAFDLFLGTSLNQAGPLRGNDSIFVHTLQAMYCREVGMTGGGQPIYSTQMDQTKLDDIHRDFTEALDEYRSSGRGQGLEPTFFEAYLKDSKMPAAVRTYDRLKQVSALLQIVAASDLSDEDQDRIQQAIVDPMRPNSMSYSDTMQTILAIGRPREFHTSYDQ
jgi:hypothetical protein